MLPILALLLLPVSMGTEYAERCPDTLKKVGLAPNYTDNIPQGDLQMVYDRCHGTECCDDLSDRYRRAECGNNLSISVTKHQPLVTLDVEGKCENVSIISFDPDVPVFNVVFLHWFVTNIPASVMKKGYSGQVGDVWAIYYLPLGFTGDHRYTFCVYCQTRYISEGRYYKGIPSRMGINPKCLVAKHHLEPPEACNFFYAVSPRLGK